jgi:predicted transcriptional regulator
MQKILKIEDHDHKIRMIEEVKIITEGLQDVEDGRVVDGNEALKHIREKYSI